MAFHPSVTVHPSVPREDPSPSLSSGPPPPPPSPHPTLITSNTEIEIIIQMTALEQDRLPIPKDARTRLFIGNLPYRVRWQGLRGLFHRAGTVLQADVSLGPDNRSRGYGTVLFATAEDATRAIEMFHGYEWQKRILEVRLAGVVRDFSDPNPALVSHREFHSPGSLYPGLPPQSIPAVPTNPERFLTLSRQITTANGSLFVGNLPFYCQWQDLKGLFRQAGTILRADVALGPDGRSRGFGTVVFASEIDAERAVKMFNGYEFGGRSLKVHHDRFSVSQASTLQLPALNVAYGPPIQIPISYLESVPQLSDHTHRQSTAAKTLDITSREVREEPDSTVSQGTTITSTSPSRFRKPPLRPPVGLDLWIRGSEPNPPPSESGTKGSILKVGTALQPQTTPRTVASQQLPMNMEGVSEEGEKPQVEEEVDETKHPEGDQPSEAVVESEHELAILAMPNSSNTDYLLERLDKQLQFGVNIVRNADGSSQPLLSHRKTCTRDDDLPLMVHPVPDSSNFVNVGTSACKRLIGRAFSPQEVTSLIEAIFMSEDEVKMVRDLRGDDAQTFIDVIHEALDLPDLQPQLRRKCISVLCWICGRQALLPRSLQIPLCYSRSDDPLYQGGFADVWKGEYQGRHVAVKSLRMYSTSDSVKITRRFCKEVVTWGTLRHPNLLSLLGITMGNGRFAMVSEWMTNGNINEFIKARKDANRFELLKGVARGLIYMHGQEMIHGDLKGANILIDENCHARLADFGLLTIVSDPTIFTASSSVVTCGTTRWMSPELLHPDQFGLKDSRPTKESDCYALGMVTYEVLSGKTPFAASANFVVMRKIIDGERPERPEGVQGLWFTDDLWEILNRCWEALSKSRPSIGAVFECLEQVSKGWEPPPEQVDEDLEDEDDWDLTGVLLPILNALITGTRNILKDFKARESESFVPLLHRGKQGSGRTALSASIGKACEHKRKQRR